MLNLFKKMQGGISMLAWVVYLLVGVSALALVVDAFGLFFLQMMFRTAAQWLVIVGGLSWGVVAFTRSRDKDLFGLFRL